MSRAQLGSPALRALAVWLLLATVCGCGGAAPGANGVGAQVDSGSPDGSGADGGPSAGALSLDSFAATPPAITAGQSTTLSWRSAGATRLTLLQAGGSAIAISGSSAQVSPSASTTYLLTASDGAGSVTLPATVTVRPVTPPPLIEQLSVDIPLLSLGTGTTLRWKVDNASSISISGVAGALALLDARSIAPLVTTTYTLTATGAGGSAQASVTVGVSAALQLVPGSPGSGDISIAIDSSRSRHPISPYIYGYNASSLAQAPAGATWLRLGGDRWTAYNWETNASNAGSDYFYESDDFLSPSSVPAAAILPTLASAQAGGAGVLVTIPMQGWVSADEAGRVDIHSADIERFYPLAPRKGSALAATPDLTDHLVYADELAQALAASWSGTAPLSFLLDNEPDLWASTHAEVEKSATSYRELFDKTIATASALKDAVPAAALHGPASYGWYGFETLQDAPDANQFVDDFLSSYLQTLQAESAQQGRRLLDVLDLHWYSEATVDGVRIIDANNSAAVVLARVQAPRSLWDPSYVEASWITRDSTGGKPIQLIPRMQAKLAGAFPGTLLSLSEYNHGGGDDISGAVAEADTLGIFGQQGLRAASYWPLLTDDSYTFGAFRAYRDYDGAGAAFGDTSVLATSSNVAQVSVYASVDASSADRVVLVLINRDTVAHTAKLSLVHSVALGSYSVWQLANPVTKSGGSVIPQRLVQGAPLMAINALSLTLPAMSVDTVVLAK